MNEINDYARYVVANNCILTLVDDEKSKNFGKVKILTGRNLKKEIGTDVNIDKRFNLAVTNSSEDLEEYLNYYMIFLREVEALISLDNPTGEFVNQLDMGYIPVFVAPTYLSNKLLDTFREAIKKTNVGVIVRSSMRPNGTYVNSDSKDIWCSRLEIAKFLGKHPCAVKIEDYLKSLIPYLKI